MPGFWMCLAVTALGLAPLSAWLQGMPFDWADGASNITSNGLLSIHLMRRNRRQR